METECFRPIAAYYRVRLMLVQMMMVVLAPAVMLLLPVQVSSGVLCLSYVVIMWREHRWGVFSPVTGTLLGASLSIFLSYAFLDLSPYEPYVPTYFFGALLLVAAGCLLRGRPATSCYGAAQGSRVLHWRTSSLWAAVYGAGVVLSLVIARDPSWFWVLPLVPVAGMIGTLWLQLVDMGPAWRRPKTFTLGGYRFEQLPSTHESLQSFYEHFIREALPSIRQGIRSERDSYEDLVSLKMAIDKPSWGQTLFFAALVDGEIVGTISCLLRTSRNTLGFETGHSSPLDLSRLRKFGKVIEVGRFSISPKHRFGQDVIQGLLRCAVEYAFETDAVFLVSQSYLSAVPIYHKIGFRQISDSVSHQLELGVAISPMVFNLARRVVCESQAHVTNRLSDVLSPYRGERYFKRMSIRSLWQRTPAWSISDQAIAGAIAAAPSNASSLPKAHAYVS